MTHAYSSRTWDFGEEVCKFEASLSYIASPYLKEKINLKRGNPGI